MDRLSGGHRHGTHSLVGIAVFSAGALAAGSYQLTAHLTGHTVFSWHLVPAALYLALLYSAALRALHIGGHHGDLLGIGGAVITCYTRWDLLLIPLWHWHVPLLALAVALGCAAHIAGDELTHGGCPIFWPVSGHEFHLVPRPLQITTAKIGENCVFRCRGGAVRSPVTRAAGVIRFAALGSSSPRCTAGPCRCRWVSRRRARNRGR